MPFLHDPISDVQSIANNLRDRYKSGFPILKEIVQNADDAKAEKLVIGWHPGIDGTTHPLLQDPGLFFVNDGPLTEADVKGIRTLGLGSKADDTNAVGKFGLGMKSLFHLGELYFFVGSDWNEYQGKFPKADILNPWDYERPEWNSFSDEDKLAIQRELTDITSSFSNDAYKFIVWIPLRSSSIARERGETGNNYIYISEDYGREVPPFLVEPDLAAQLGKLFPMLKHLRLIKGFAFLPGNRSPIELFSTEIDTPANRIQFPNIENEILWHGSITINGRLDELSSKINYVGTEVYLTSEPLKQLKKNNFWPISYARNSSGREQKILDKAEPHSTTLLLARQSNNNSKLTVKWAVFLPLGEQDTSEENQVFETPIEGNMSFDILLHGYFFIDAGRVGIHGRKDIGNRCSLVIDSEDKATQEWNRLLANEGTLPRILTSLSLASTKLKLTLQQIEQLTKGLSLFLDSSIGLGCQYHVTSVYQWVYKISRESKGWTLVSSSKPIRKLPKPNSEEYERVWSTFPNLFSISDDLVFVDRSKPNINARNDETWCVDELVELLDSVPTSVFESPKLLGYLNIFLQCVTTQEHDCQMALIRLAQSAFNNIDLLNLSKNQSALKEFTSFIFSTYRWSVKVEKDEQALWDIFSTIRTDKLFVPAFLEKGDSTGTLDFVDADKLFEQLGKQELNDVQLSKATDTILASIDKTQVDILIQRHDSLKLFSAFLPGSTKPYRESSRKLNELFQGRRLFKRSSLDSGSFSLGPQLNEALASIDIVFINDKVNQQLFDRKVRVCDTSAILHLLAKRPPLNTPQSRKSLISKLEINDGLDFEQCLSVRYLIHGSLLDHNVSTPLWSIGGDDAVWSRVIRESLSEDTIWTIVPHELSASLKLDPREKRIINLEEGYAHTVLEKLGDDIQYLDYKKIIVDVYDAEQILRKIEDKNVWCSLPLHKTQTGEFCSIEANCFLESNIELPEELKKSVTWITPAVSKEVQTQQDRNIEKLTPYKAIELALDGNEPSKYQSFILEQLKHCTLIDSIFDVLVNTPWLTVVDIAVPPSMVVLADKDEWTTTYKLSRISGDIFFSETLDIFNTPDLDTIKSLLVSNPNKIANLALTAAVNLPEYYVGCGNITNAVLKQAMQYKTAFINSELKGWELLIECFNCSPEGSLTEETLNGLSKPVLNAHQLVLAHEELVSCASSAKSIADIRNVLLTMICNQGDPLRELAKLRLRALNDEFIPSKRLCYGTVGVIKSSILHDEDFNAIEQVLPISEEPSLEGEDLVERLKNQNLADERVESSAKEIQDYFSDWEPFITNKTAIGAVLALMSGNTGIKELCESYIGQRTYSNFINEIGQNWDKSRRTYSSLEQFVSKIQFDIRLADDSEILARSIFNEEINVKLEASADSIFVWNTTRLFYSGPISIQLRNLRVVDMEEEKLLAILKNSAELFLHKIYQQKLTLDHIWDKFSGAEQLDILAAKLTVMDGIVHQLKELRLNVPELKILLNSYNELLASEAEHHQLLSGVQKSELLEKICDVVQEKVIKQQILNAVKLKIEQAQYQPSSVPFELFQNADDAAVELKLLGFPESEIYRRAIFKVRVEDGNLVFFNWGREINQYSSSHRLADGNQYRFKTDLQKMLVRNQSDKDEETTGKFGLGFKSCLLVSDNPNIVSGRLAVQIEGGLLPTVSPEHEQLFRLAKSEMLDGQNRPTIISLPLRKGVDVDGVLSRFRKQAGLLTVFSKCIHTIEFDGTIFNWSPKSSKLIADVCIGTARIPTKTRYSDIKVIHVSTRSGNFVFALSDKGFKPLKSDVPKLWNLSPLLGEFGIGFAINASFDIDIGRNQLSISSLKNKQLFELLSRELNKFLTNLYLTCQDNWSAVKDEWELPDDLDIADFWGSLWNTLLVSTSGSSPLAEGEAIESFTNRLFTTEGGILSFYHSYQAFPASINAGPQRLVNLKSVSYRAGELADNMLKHIVNLPVVSELLKAQKIVGFEVGKSLLALGVEVATIDLADFIEKTLEDDYLSPLTAEKLCSIFDTDFEIKLKECKATQEQVDHFRRKLAALKVRVKNGSLRLVKECLVCQSKASSADEAMVMSFAPSEFIICEQYSRSIEFIEFCRRDATPYNLDILFDWICRREIVDNQTKQQAICRYLIEGHFGEDLSNKIKKEFKPDWVFRVDVQHLNSWGWSKKQIDLFRNVRMITEAEIVNRVDSQLKSEGRSRLSTQESLIRIYEWWEKEGAVWLPEYEKELYPSGSFDWQAIMQDEQPERYKLAWLKLFFLGSCQTIGRSKEVQHKAALNHFEQKGWWSVFSDTNDPTLWFDVMDQYLMDAVTSDIYRTWLQILPLYRFSSYLDNYIDLFWSAENGLPNIDALVRPSSSNELSGSGSSFSPPELKATLGIGANFILRELYRHDIYMDESLEKYCFVASKGVRDLLSNRLPDFPTLTEPSAKISQEIYEHLCTYIGEECATFGGSFDIPLRILSRSVNRSLLEDILEIGVWS